MKDAQKVAMLRVGQDEKGKAISPARPTFRAPIREAPIQRLITMLTDRGPEFNIVKADV
jgi:hypothetical protein